MYQNYYQYPQSNYQYSQSEGGNQDDRFLGLFAVPFILGGLTGAALTPRRPYPVPYPYPVYTTPYYSYNNYYPTYYK